MNSIIELSYGAKGGTPIPNSKFGVCRKNYLEKNEKKMKKYPY